MTFFDVSYIPNAFTFYKISLWRKIKVHLLFTKFPSGEKSKAGAISGGGLIF
jgi:hypothetical protein